MSQEQTQQQQQEQQFWMQYQKEFDKWVAFCLFDELPDDGGSDSKN